MRIGPTGFGFAGPYPPPYDVNFVLVHFVIVFSQFNSNFCARFNSGSNPIANSWSGLEIIREEPWLSFSSNTMIHGGELRAMQLVAEKKPESSLDGFFTKFARSAPVLFLFLFLGGSFQRTQLSAQVCIRLLTRATHLKRKQLLSLDLCNT